MPGPAPGISMAIDRAGQLWVVEDFNRTVLLVRKAAAP